MRHKQHAAVAMAALIALVASACGSSTSSKTPGGSTEAPAGSSSGAAAPTGDNTLTIWDMETPPNRVAAFKKLEDEYNATNPTYKVEFQTQNWGDVYTKIAAAAQAKKQPDLLFTIPDFTTYVRQLGIAQPVTDMFNKLDSTYKFTDSAKAPYHDGDNYWAIPLYGQVYVMWYRKDLFEKAGIAEAPKTWSELLADAKKLTTNGINGVALPAGKNLATDQSVYTFMTTGNAAEMFDGSGKLTFDTSNTVAAFDLYKQLLAYSPKDSGSFAWGEVQAALDNGTAAIQFGMGNFGPFDQESGASADTLGCAPIPTADAGGQPGSIYYSNGVMVLTSDSARRAGAEAFLNWLLNTDRYGDLLNAEPGLFLPVTEGGATAESWRSNALLTKYSHCTDVMLDQAKTGKLFGFVGGHYTQKIGDISSQNFLAQGVQQMYANGMSPADAVKWTNQQMESALK